MDEAKERATLEARLRALRAALEKSSTPLARISYQTEMFEIGVRLAELRLYFMDIE